jgi:DNA-binding CsgD family transcriptional regulator
MTELERKVVDLIEEGYARWGIAEQLGIGETKVRNTIVTLCARYNCRMRDLPRVVNEKGEDFDGN